MDAVTRSELATLAAAAETPCVTLTMSLHRGFPQSKEDVARFRVLADESFARLTADGCAASQAEALLADARKLQADEAFWKTHGADGLVVLSAPGLFRKYTLPYGCPDVADVGEGFFLNPLLRRLTWGFDFLLLALSPKQLRLYRCDRTTITRIDLPPGTPDSIQTALAGTEIEKSLQYHTAAGFGVGGGLAGAASGHVGTAHGHGAPKDDEKKLLVEYCQIVSRHLEPFLNREQLPLVVAAVEYCHAMFHSTCRYPLLLERGVIASPDGLNEREMHARAVPEIERRQQSQLQQLVDRELKLAAGTRTSESLEQILPAARRGQVRTLVAQFGLRIWGRFDPEGETVAVHEPQQPGDVDLLDFALKQTLLHGGDVHVAPPEELPNGKPLIAVFRW